MKIIAKPRRCGKTTELIRMADGRNGFIVVPHAGMAGYVKDLAREMGATINDPVTLDDVVNGSPKLVGLKFGTPLFFDNVEMMLEMLAPRFHVQAATINTGKLPKEHLGLGTIPTLTPKEREEAERKARFDCLAIEEEIRVRGRL